MLINIFETLAQKLKQGHRCCLVTLTEATGSTPGRAGFAMMVCDDGTCVGTVGGGAVEQKIINDARECIKSGKDMQFAHDLSAAGEMGMLCGGSVKGQIQVFGNMKKLVIFGGGHVAKYTAAAMRNLDFHVTVVDDREELAVGFDNSVKFLAVPAQEVAQYIKFDKNTFVVIATRGHAGDAAALHVLYNAHGGCGKRAYEGLHDKEAASVKVGKECSSAQPCAYIGMIGSRAKIASTFDMLSKEGISQEWLEKVHTPIGFDIDDGTAPEIAIAIVSEILHVKNQKEVVQRKR